MATFFFGTLPSNTPIKIKVDVPPSNDKSRYRLSLGLGEEWFKEDIEGGYMLTFIGNYNDYFSHENCIFYNDN